MELKQVKPIKEVKNYYITVLGDQVKNFLSIDNDFPRWKQMALMTLETQMMRKYVQGELDRKELGIYQEVCAINDWKNGIEANYVEATLAINMASKVQEIREIVNSFKYPAVPHEIDTSYLRFS